MIPQTISSILLAIPLIVMIIPSIRYWQGFRESRKDENTVRKPKYRKPFYQLLVTGVLFMWIFWISGILFQLLNIFYIIFGFLVFSTPFNIIVQIVGFFIFYIGAASYILCIIYAGRNLRPSFAGVKESHRLIQEGPYKIIRHPLYVSYILILIGLSFILLLFWLLIPTLCIIFGIYPTAKAEEAILIEQFGEEYLAYQQKVGMLVPKLLSRTNVEANN